MSVPSVPALPPRPVATLAFVAAIALVYAALVLADGHFDIGAETIVDFGGIIPFRYMGDEYWRLLTAGFLHFGPLHLVTNVICVLAWGVPLERMFGPARFAVLLLLSIVGASLASILSRSEVFIGAGASGGASGLLGALFLLWLRRRLMLPASYFGINIGLNIVLAVMVPGIDWQAHAGGFATGALLMAVLSLRPDPPG